MRLLYPSFLSLHNTPKTPHCRSQPSFFFLKREQRNVTMARRANIPLSDGGDYDAQTTTRQNLDRVNGVASLSPSPAASFSSDKENHVNSARPSRSINGKSKSMQAPKLPTPASAEDGTPRAAKRRRLGERGVPNASQVAHEKELDKLGHNQVYDPNQSMDERRAVRKGIRDLSKELTGW